jgi:hypothetical protein
VRLLWEDHLGGGGPTLEIETSRPGPWISQPPDIRNKQLLFRRYPVYGVLLQEPGMSGRGSKSQHEPLHFVVFTASFHPLHSSRFTRTVLASYSHVPKVDAVSGLFQNNPYCLPFWAVEARRQKLAFTAWSSHVPQPWPMKHRERSVNSASSPSSWSLLEYSRCWRNGSIAKEGISDTTDPSHQFWATYIQNSFGCRRMHPLPGFTHTQTHS